MKCLAALFLTGFSLALLGCESQQREAPLATSMPPPPTPAASSGGVGTHSRDVAMARAEAVSAKANLRAGEGQGPARESLNSAASAQASDQAAERKIINNAELTIETDTPNEGQQKIATIAEKHGGFVVISESKQNDAISQNVAS